MSCSRVAGAFSATCRELHDPARYGIQTDLYVNHARARGLAWHAIDHARCLVLRQHASAAGLHGVQSGDAVVAHAGEDDGQHAGAERIGCGLKQI